MKCESKSDTGNNRGDWNHVKVIPVITGATGTMSK